MHASSLLNVNKINLIKAKTIKDGISLQFANSDDFRKAVKLFTAQKIEHHTWQLPSEEMLHVVMQGVPDPIGFDLIESELKELGYHLQNVVCEKHTKN